MEMKTWMKLQYDMSRVFQSQTNHTVQNLENGQVRSGFGATTTGCKWATAPRSAVKPCRSRADVSSDVTSSDVVVTRCRLTGERHDAPESPGRVVARPDEIRQNRTHEKRPLEACKKK